MPYFAILTVMMWLVTLRSYTMMHQEVVMMGIHMSFTPFKTVVAIKSLLNYTLPESTR